MPHVVTSGSGGGGSGITALTGDVSASGTGSVAATISALALSKLATQTTQTIIGNGSGSTAVPVALIISSATGLIADATTLKNTLTQGVSGGQTIVGGTSASDGITFSSTSNATKGVFQFGGNTGFTYDENAKNMRIGISSMQIGSNWLAQFKANVSVGSGVYIENAGAGQGYASFALGTDDTGSGSASKPYYDTLLTNTAYTAAGLISAGGVLSRMFPGAAGNWTFYIGANNGDYIWATRTSAVSGERLRLTNLGSLTMGVGNTTSATDGFLYLSGSAGVPTGTPTSLNSGHVIPLTSDYTNDKASIYSNSNWYALNRDSKGSDIASASTITPTQTWRYYHITGTTTINYITFTGFQDGNDIELYFVSALILTNNAGSVPGTAYALQLVSGADASMAAGSKIKLRRDTALTKWVEVTRSAA